MIICIMLAPCVGATLILHRESGWEEHMFCVLKYEFVWREKSDETERILVLKAESWEAGQIFEMLLNPLCIILG